jgi:hypothetical protein
MPSSGMWRRVDLVWTDVSEEHIAFISGWKNPRARNQCEQVATATSFLNISLNLTLIIYYLYFVLILLFFLF